MLKITENLKIGGFSSMKVENPTLCSLYEVENTEDLIKLFSDENFVKQKFQIIGEGTNTIFTTNEKINLIRLSLKEIQILGDTLRASAGVNWDTLVQKYIEAGGRGMSALSIIPGTVGASPVQNIGAYGKEVSEFIHSVEVFNTETKKQETLPNSACNFSYRNSIFKDSGKNILFCT